MVSRHEEDPYERDSDHEYEALEADRGDDDEIIEQAEEYSSVDIGGLNRGDDEVEDAYPSEAETRIRTAELQEMLDEAVNRDPEVLASDQSWRHAPDSEEDLTPEAQRLFDRITEFTPDGFDLEDIADPG